MLELISRGSRHLGEKHHLDLPVISPTPDIYPAVHVSYLQTCPDLAVIYFSLVPPVEGYPPIRPFPSLSQWLISTMHPIAGFPNGAGTNNYWQPLFQASELPFSKSLPIGGRDSASGDLLQSVGRGGRWFGICHSTGDDAS